MATASTRSTDDHSKILSEGTEMTSSITEKNQKSYGGYRRGIIQRLRSGWRKKHSATKKPNGENHKPIVDSTKL